ncbi:MAG: D-alanine--D-alanine ligase [Chloroflexota bacterium]|nr:D-alanine--D-alanine ligase [Chloroflexota bacterium]
MTSSGERLRIGVIFGGRSGEHEVSLRSASFVMDSLDRAKYDVVPIGIGKQGEWLLDADPMRRLSAAPAAESGASLPVTLPTAHLPAAGRASVGALDLVFPMLHGTYGEDGTVQGLLELADLPYVGSGVTGSAVAMDKGLANTILRDHGLPVGSWQVVTAPMWRADPAIVRADIEARLSYPLFVKPCNLGSSVGVSKVHHAGELDDAMAAAAEFDRRIIVEQGIPNAREIEVSILGNDEPEASVCGEVVPAGEFYDYVSKYEDDRSQAIVPADLPPALADRIRQDAVRAFCALDCAGYARVDFLVDAETLEPVIGEINTIPGFTEISMYPKLWEASGVPARELMDRLIRLALERHQERRSLRTSYT